MIPLVAPSYDEVDIAAIADAARARLIGSGEATRSFEAEAAAVVGHTRGWATSSGTSALILALAALDPGPDAEVIMPSYTCVALLHAAAIVGVRPVLVDNTFDIASLQFNIDPEATAAAVSDRTVAIVVPHAFGVAGPTSQLTTLGVPVIEDCAMAFGARVGGAPLGSFGSMATVSFHESKVISAGAGGMVFASTPALASRLDRLTGYTEAQPRQRSLAPGEVSGRYELAYHLPMTDLQSALGRAQLSRLPGFLERRRQIAAAYDSALGDLVDCPVAVPDGAVVFRYLVRIRESLSVPGVLADMERFGVEAGRGVYPTLDQLLGSDGWDRSNAHRGTRELLSLPVHPALGDEDVERVIAATRTALTGAGP